MSNIFGYLCVWFCIVSQLSEAQSTRKYLTEKPGKWMFYNNLNKSGAEYDLYVKNVTDIAAWFHHNIPIMTSPRGFDLHATIFGIWDEDYKKRACNYGLRSELNFDFQLFLKEDGKETQWTVEPPHWNFYINNTSSGHGINFHFEVYNESKDDPSLKIALDKVTSDLNDLFLVFPFEKELTRGVSLFGDGNLIIYNPERPPFWLPVTVREVVELKLAFYSIREDDKQWIYPYVKAAADKLTSEELDSPAYDGSEDAILKVNGLKEGLQIMKFNTNYWDRSMPPSAVQLITLYYHPADQFNMDEFIRDNGHPNYGQLVTNSLKLNELRALLADPGIRK